MSHWCWRRCPGERSRRPRSASPIRRSPGPDSGRHVVFLTGDEEYRSEEGLPMLAKILSQRHGFKTSVLFSVDEDGTINPKNTSSLSDPAILDSADAIVMLLRFRNWPDETMARFERRLQAGTPIIALRTSTHAFNGAAEGRPLGDVELQQRRRIRQARARRDVADPLGTAQGRGDARRHRGRAAQAPGAARRRRSVRRHRRLRGLPAGRCHHSRARCRPEDADAGRRAGRLPQEARDGQAGAGRQRSGDAGRVDAHHIATTTARPIAS